MQVPVLQHFVIRLVLATLLTVNFAWATDIHGPGQAGDLHAGAAHSTGAAAHADSDPHDGGGPGHDHCLHCYGGAVHQPTLDLRPVAMNLPAAGGSPPELDPDRPSSRSALPPERPPRA